MRTTRTLAAAVLSAVTLACPAFAMPTDPPHKPAQPPVVQPAAPSDGTSSGLDWGSAAIGAAGGVGAFAIALAGIAGTRRRRLANPGPLATHWEPSP
jgi:NADPH:quinone reductase-like Zn-dependent oxidoreductase